jgi:hypothetical protein
MKPTLCTPALIEGIVKIPRAQQGGSHLGDLNVTNKTNKLPSFINKQNKQTTFLHKQTKQTNNLPS